MLSGVVMGLIIAIPLGTIEFFVRKAHDIDLLYSVLLMSLIVNFVLITLPFIFRYASKSKDKVRKE